MNVESVRDYCLSLPLATEDFPFDETTLAFRVLIPLQNIAIFIRKVKLK